MQDRSLLISAMAEKCKAMIQQASSTPHNLPALPETLQLPHLLWMCNQIEQHADTAPETKLHRWIGFVQAGMLANRILDLQGARSMFDAVKNAYGVTADDQDLLDHLDPTNSFEIELGGQG
jgi:hypothetical protein